MVFKILSSAELAKTYKQTRTSSVSETEEWGALMDALSKGLKKGQSAVIEIAPKSQEKAELKKAKALQGNFKRAVKKHLVKYSLPYSARALKDGVTKNLIVIVEHKAKR